MYINFRKQNFPGNERGLHMKRNELKEYILSGGIDKVLSEDLSVTADDIAAQRIRYAEACDAFGAKYGEDGDVSLYSVGGRSEISGNHTDHNHGKVIAASVNLDILAFAKPADNGVIRIQSAGFPEDIVEPAAIDAPDPAKFFTSASIIAGMEKAFLNAGYKVGGFDAYTTSNVLKGSGISSSAAFEVMVGNILNHLYNDGKVSNVEIAKMAQYAENEYFGKPCGLMDQTACAVGGFITIDFADPKNPIIRKIGFDMNELGYALCIVNTGGNHADLNEDYASVPAEMKMVARELGVSVLRETNEEALLADIVRIRQVCGDRAVMRAMHFFAENKRVDMQVAGLMEGDMDRFKEGVVGSGSSSFKYLQNVYTTKNVGEQGLSLALCLTENFLAGTGAVCRVHGGGFAGTIQVFVPVTHTKAYREYMDSVFGAGSCHILQVRRSGAVQVVK